MPSTNVSYVDTVDQRRYWELLLQQSEEGAESKDLPVTKELTPASQRPTSSPKVSEQAPKISPPLPIWAYLAVLFLIIFCIGKVVESLDFTTQQVTQKAQQAPSAASVQDALSSFSARSPSPRQGYQYYNRPNVLDEDDVRDIVREELGSRHSLSPTIGYFPTRVPSTPKYMPSFPPRPLDVDLDRSLISGLPGERQIEIRPQYDYDPSHKYRGTVNEYGHVRAKSFEGDYLRGNIDDFGYGRLRDDEGNTYRVRPW